MEWQIKKDGFQIPAIFIAHTKIQCAQKKKLFAQKYRMPGVRVNEARGQLSMAFSDDPFPSSSKDKPSYLEKKQYIVWNTLNISK